MGSAWSPGPPSLSADPRAVGPGTVDSGFGCRRFVDSRPGEGIYTCLPEPGGPQCESAACHSPPAPPGEGLHVSDHQASICDLQCPSLGLEARPSRMWCWRVEPAVEKHPGHWSRCDGPVCLPPPLHPWRFLRLHLGFLGSLGRGATHTGFRTLARLCRRSLEVN